MGAGRNFYLIIARGMGYLDPAGSWENCIPREWDHVSDGLLGGGVYSGFVIEVSVVRRFCIRPLILLYHVEDMKVEHVLAVACLMRLLERYDDNVHLEYLSTWSPAAAVITGGGCLCSHEVMEILGRMVDDSSVCITRIEWDSPYDIIRGFLDAC